MSIDALAQKVFELQFAFGNPQQKELDAKIQQVIKEYKLLKPDSPALSEFFKDVKVENLSKEEFFKLIMNMRASLLTRLCLKLTLVIG